MNLEQVYQMESNLLTMEQQFELRAKAALVKNISRAELEALFIEVYRQKMAQANLFQGLMNPPEFTLEQMG